MEVLLIVTGILASLISIWNLNSTLVSLNGFLVCLNRALVSLFVMVMKTGYTLYTCLDYTICNILLSTYLIRDKT